MRERKSCITFILLFLLFTPILEVYSLDFQNESDHAGPYLESIAFKFIPQDDQMVLALVDGSIDLIGDAIDPTFYEYLLEDGDVEISEMLRNGYGYMAFNCEKYPFNISRFRQAIAFAVDKYQIAEDIWDNLATPLDSLVPQQNPLSCEGNMSFSYYESDNDTAIEIMDNLGFLDINEDGYRELPNGSLFDVRVDYTTSSNIAAEVAEVFVNAYLSIGINATSYPYDFYIYPYDPYTGHYENYDMVFGGRSFGSFDLQWMAYPFSQGFTLNLPRWSNETYDSWGDQLLSASAYDEVAEAAEEMQRIWLQECPLIICYQNILLNAYRSDIFGGFVNTALEGVPDFWSYYKVRLNSEPIGHIGGDLQVGLPLSPDTFNLMTSSSAYTQEIMDLLYDSLLKISPQGDLIPWLAMDYSIQTSSDDESISEGHSRILWRLLENATWSDGRSLTAEDIRYCLSYYKDAEGLPLGEGLEGITAIYTPTNYSLIVEFNTTSYWNVYTIGLIPILPKHLLEDIGLEGWSSWDPDPLEDEMIASGPFKITDFHENEYIELSRNPSFYYQPPSITTSSTDSDNTSTTIDPMFVTIIGIAGMGVITISMMMIYRTRRIQ